MAARKHIVRMAMLLAAWATPVHAQVDENALNCADVSPYGLMQDKAVEAIIVGRIFEATQVPPARLPDQTYPNRVLDRYKVLVEKSWKGAAEGSMIEVEAVAVGPWIPTTLAPNEHGYFMVLNAGRKAGEYTFNHCSKLVAFEPEYRFMIGFGRDLGKPDDQNGAQNQNSTQKKK